MRRSLNLDWLYIAIGLEVFTFGQRHLKNSCGRILTAKLITPTIAFLITCKKTVMAD